MNCGNLWMGRIMRLWSVTRSGLESWLSCREGWQAQCKWWLGLALSLHTELGWWEGCSTPLLHPLFSFARKKLSKHMRNTFYPNPGEDSLLLLAPRRGLTWIPQALLYFPGFLRFHAGQAAPGDAVVQWSLFAAPERKFLPALVSHFDQHL